MISSRSKPERKINREMRVNSLPFISSTIAIARLTASGFSYAVVLNTAPWRRIKLTPFLRNRAVRAQRGAVVLSCGGPFTAQNRRVGRCRCEQNDRSFAAMNPCSPASFFVQETKINRFVVKRIRRGIERAASPDYRGRLTMAQGPGRQARSAACAHCKNQQRRRAKNQTQTFCTH